MRPNEYRLNDCTITIDEDGVVKLEWDHGDIIEVFDSGGYLTVTHDGEAVLNGEFSKECTGCG